MRGVGEGASIITVQSVCEFFRCVSGLSFLRATADEFFNVKSSEDLILLMFSTLKILFVKKIQLGLFD